MRRPGTVFVALALLALAAAGCGGGGGDESTTAAATTEAAALSKEELVAQGNAICAEVNAAVGTVGSTSSDASGQATQVAGLYGGMVERLEGLGAPSDESAGYAEFIAAAKALAQAENDIELATQREESAALSEAEAEASAALQAFQSAASSFGLDQCAAAPAAPTPSSGGGGAGGEEAGGVEPEAAPEEVAPEEIEATPEAGGAGAVEEGGGGGVGAGESGGIGPG